MGKKANITVIKVPKEITFECPHCGEDVTIEYGEFCDMVGEPCDWNYEKFDCPECNEEVDIDYVEWI